MKSRIAMSGLYIVAVIGVLTGFSGLAYAHCDTIDGPVVQDARKALETKNVTPILKWVREKNEKTVRDAYAKALAARGKNNSETEEQRFFATLVKIHRAGEGAPFSGLKPAGTVEPAVAEADKALAGGSPDALVKLVTDAVAAGIRERHERAVAAAGQKDESVAKGREFVEAYVEYTHYVERIHVDAAGKNAHGEKSDGKKAAQAGHGDAH